jgi:deoxyribose-phosphate aldolase
VNLATFLDSTNLRPEAREKDIQELCREAAQYKFAAVCVHPYRLRLAKTLLAGSGVKLCTVVGFPLGADGLANKIYTARESLEEGADELDMVVNIGAFKDRDYATVGWEIRSLLHLKTIIILY